MAERPELARPELLLGLAWHQQKDYARARPHLERAAAAGPVFERQAAAHYYLGWCLYYLGEPEGARASFLRHLELDPSEGDSHFGLGLVALDAGLLDEAETRFRSAGELLARKMQQGKPALAREVAKCHARLADVCMLRERWAEARSELEACLKLHAAHYEAWYKLSVAHRRLGDEAGAAEALRQFEQWKARARPAEVSR